MHISEQEAAWNGLPSLAAQIHVHSKRCRTVHPDVVTKFATELNKCTFAATRRVEHVQTLYGCVDHDISITRGFCEACRQACHKVSNA